MIPSRGHPGAEAPGVQRSPPSRSSKSELIEVRVVVAASAVVGARPEGLAVEAVVARRVEVGAHAIAVREGLGGRDAAGVRAVHGLS